MLSHFTTLERRRMRSWNGPSPTESKPSFPSVIIFSYIKTWASQVISSRSITSLVLYTVKESEALNDLSKSPRHARCKHETALRLDYELGILDRESLRQHMSLFVAMSTCLAPVVNDRISSARYQSNNESRWTGHTLSTLLAITVAKRSSRRHSRREAISLSYDRCRTSTTYSPEIRNENERSGVSPGRVASVSRSQRVSRFVIMSTCLAAIINDDV
jgi:hypothetical protein